MKHVFKKPYTFNGVEHKEMDFNLEDLTTLDHEKAEKQFKMLNPGFIGLVETEGGFLKQILANSASVPIEFFNKMPLHEFVTLKFNCQGFLLGSGATNSEQLA